MLQETETTYRVNPATLPEDIENQFAAVAQGVGSIHRMLGRIVDEYMANIPQGARMAVYESFADLYHRVTGENISARTIRTWRKSAVEFSKNDLQEFHALSDSMLTEAVSLAEMAKTDAREICEWAVDHAIKSVPQLRAHWLPPESGPDIYRQDPPVVSSLLRYVRRFDGEKLARFQKLIDEIRQLLRELEDGRKDE